MNAHLEWINIARRESRFADALDRIQQLPADVREQFQIMAHEADLLGKVGDHERELAMYDELVIREPTMASLWLSKGQALKTLGRKDEALAAFREAIQIQPAYGKGWWCLAEVKQFRFDDADLAAMDEALNSGIGPADRLHLHFALGKAFEDRNEPARAFEHYSLANELRAASIPPAAMSVTQRVDRAIETFTPEFYASRLDQGFASSEPIFIVGLQRSGSTLIEQILASHPDIEGTSELSILSRLCREIALDDAIAGRDLMEKITSLDAARLSDLGEAYVKQAAAFRLTDRARFIDKQPSNWIYAGLIRLILPNARIIDARRSPMATGFSNFKQNYGSGVVWSYSLATIGRYYRDYARLMAHFDCVQPGSIHRVINEQLIDDFEPEVRRLLDYVGVPFDPRCLEFHRNERAVRTPSAEQVRRPINREGIDQWRAFEPWLGELKDALGLALEGWDSPPGTYRDDISQELK